uniref:Ig-like domain-containing protein n=1 Tax=Sphenodon punctatus TaxID=8508 RepID=A0A8D0GKP2_SPHPU
MLNLEHMDYNLTWYKTGNQTSVSKDQHSRIYQYKNFIWFLPATLEDSGSYECVVRNLTSCSKIYLTLTVFKNKAGICFNEKFAIHQKILTALSPKIVCPYLDYFRDQKNKLPIVWYKDCKLIEDKRFLSSHNYLVITNATMHDQGNYTCKTLYNHKGKQHNISRDISLTVTVSPPNIPPEIFYPRNNSVEVEVGSRVIVDCNVLGAEACQVFWKVNDTYIDLNYEGRVFEEEIYEEEISFEGRLFCKVRLNISEPQIFRNH